MPPLFETPDQVVKPVERTHTMGDIAATVWAPADATRVAPRPVSKNEQALVMTDIFKTTTSNDNVLGLKPATETAAATADATSAYKIPPELLAELRKEIRQEVQQELREEERHHHHHHHRHHHNHDGDGPPANKPGDPPPQNPENPTKPGDPPPQNPENPPTKPGDPPPQNPENPPTKPGDPPPQNPENPPTKPGDPPPQNPDGPDIVPTNPGTDGSAGGGGNKAPTYTQSVEWLDEKMHSLAVDTISENDIRRGLLGKGPFRTDNPQEKEMLHQVLDHYDEIRAAHKDDVGGHSFGPIHWGRSENDSITMKDMDVTKVLSERQDGAQEMTHALVQGEPQFFRILDSASNGQEDGKIGKGDLQRFLRDYDRFTAGGEKPMGFYTQENADLVQRMLNGWDKLDSPTALMRGIAGPDDIKKLIVDRSKDYDFITADTLGKAMKLGKLHGNRNDKLEELSDLV